MKRKVVFLGIILIVLCLVLTGCGKNEENNSENAGETEESANENADALKDLELYSDDTKIVFRNGDGALVFYCKDNVITAYHTYIKYENEATAKIALDMIDEKDETIDKKYVKGSYLVVEYAKSEYENLTVDEIRQTYSYLKELKK